MWEGSQAHNVEGKKRKNTSRESGPCRKRVRALEGRGWFGCGARCRPSRSEDGSHSLPRVNDSVPRKWAAQVTRSADFFFFSYFVLVFLVVCVFGGWAQRNTKWTHFLTWFRLQRQIKNSLTSSVAFSLAQLDADSEPAWEVARAQCQANYLQTKWAGNCCKLLQQCWLCGKMQKSVPFTWRDN